MEVDEGSDQKSDIWPHWMVGHAYLKNEFTEDKKFQNLTSWLIYWNWQALAFKKKTIYLHLLTMMIELYLNILKYDQHEKTSLMPSDRFVAHMLSGHRNRYKVTTDNN